jgi:SAM-dependent methyltransferase
MVEMGAKVTAVDFSDGMLARARTKPDAAAVRFLKADLNRCMPLASRAFDRVVSFLALDHVAALDLLFQEMARLCRPDGRIVVSVMHPAMVLRGVEAHFKDPATGREIWPESSGNSFSDYVVAANRANLAFEHLSEHSVDEALAEYAPGVRKHIGWPLLLLARLKRF